MRRARPSSSSLFFTLLSIATGAVAQDATEPMVAVTGLDRAGTALAATCSTGDAASCTALADARLRAGDGAAANALYRRAADLARLATTPATLVRVSTHVRSAADAIAALEASWTPTVVPAAAALGHDAFARSAPGQIFGAGAVTTWRSRRARRSDAFRTVHTMRTREGAAFASLAWIGDLGALAAPGDVWELTLGYMNLDFVAYVDDAGTVVALVHVPEG